MAKASLYPPNPVDVPEELTQPTSQYKTQTLMVLLALGLFFFLYFGLMFFCVLFALWAVFLCPFEQRPGGFPWPLVKVFSLVMCVPFGILFIYLLKNLFKFERAKKEFLIEVFEDEHPKLFQFITQVCADVGAPIPKHVYVDYAVNAAAMPDTTSLFHMFMPTGKSLLIGLGLLNCINLTEFKAMLAHEFGHFSQKTMKIGTYVYTVHRILYQIVYGEDFFDRFIIGWSHVDPRIAWPAYIVRAVLWCLRKVLGLLWYVVVFFDRALSRQMEFNADLIAVSLTGSDAPVHLLYRCHFADACFGQAIDDLRIAMSHHLYTSDLFYHQSAAAGILRTKNKDPRLGEPPILPANAKDTTEVFEEDDDKVAQMWQTHPSGYDREQNAKAHYIRTEFDERSPWLLFDNVEDLRERVTYKFYRFYFKIPKDVVLADPEEVQGFIDDEHADRTYDPRYQGLYDNRNLLITDLNDLAKDGAKQPWSITELGQTHATLYNAEVKHRSQLYYKRLEEFHFLNAVQNDWIRVKDDELEFRGEIYEPDDAKRLFKKVDKELKKDNRWIEEQDCRVFMTYFQMALHINQEVANELYRRYDFHLKLQDIWFELQKQKPPIDAAIAFLNSQESSQMQPHHFQELLDIFREAHKTMKGMLRTAKDMDLPALKNLPAGQPLRPFLLEKNLIDGLSKYERSITVRWVNRLLDQYHEMKGKVDRIHFKSLAGILALQEKIGSECTRRWSSLPAVKPVER
ncbi:MAG: M48 family metalloprotease [Planctomycetes bacterium]|nr:M48 family metalloprotease [Planctomycetota bacterium]